MLTNTVFSHSNEECSPYFLVITHQTQARDDIDGLMQERRNSIANALGHVFLAPSHPYKECHLWSPPPPPPPPHPPCYFVQCNEIKMTMPWVILFFLILSLVMYWAYSITLYCTATYREYHVATVIFMIPNHFHHSQYLYWLLKSIWRCSVTQRCTLDVSLILCYSSVPSSDYLKIVGMTNMQLLKCNIFVSV